MPLSIKQWGTHMDTMGAMIDTFTNGIDAVRARNKALDSLQLGLFIGLAPFFNAFGELKGAGFLANTIKDSAFAGITYAVSRAKEDLRPRCAPKAMGILSWAIL